ncbi:hypothetical protein CFB48_12455 [Burkholderia sp. AU33647]|nr:hypothetical protein CFB48_12455 [Burkholderia sp. AU33647]
MHRRSHGCLLSSLEYRRVKLRIAAHPGWNLAIQSGDASILRGSRNVDCQGFMRAAINALGKCPSACCDGGILRDTIRAAERFALK